ncbi:MAG: aminoacyl-tRNA hydrolase [Deltaproteobacteria bacterium]|nr:aminoacyl-tRNA hydrolase [Deltaproteobacteria bacterium]
MFIILGLGNPGPSYADTRHNIGFMVVDRFSASHGIRIEKDGGSFIWGRGSVSGTEVVAAKPLTFMNLSGAAVKKLLSFFGALPESMLVVYDDCDLPAGRLRLRKSGGHGGHGGMRSIIEHTGSRDFPRLRMGIGRDGKADKGLKAYVLSPFSPAERGLVEEEMEKGVSAIEAVITDGVEGAMNRYNRMD